MKSIAVVIPFYNRVELLKVTLDSVMQQTMMPGEIIVVDDGSESDNHEAAKQLISSYDTEINLFRKENGGTATARNHGFQQSKSDYIIFLDSDDLIMPKRIESDQSLLKENDYDMIYGPSYTFSDDINQMKFMRSQHQRNLKFLEKNRAENMLLMRLHLASPNVATINRNLISKLNGFDESIRYSEDYDFWVRLFRIDPNIYYRHEALSAYRFSPDHRSKSKDFEKKVLSRLKINEKFFENPANQALSNLRRPALSRLYQTLANDYWADKNFEKFRHYFKKALDYGFFNLSNKTKLRYIKSLFK